MAAERGDELAQNNLGVMYSEGIGVPQDYDEAASWYRLAAEQGNAVAQNSLANLRQKGLGVQQDYVQALVWFNLAAAQGDDEAIEARDKITKLMTATQIAEARHRAREWLEAHR